MASMLSALLTKKPSVPKFKPVDFGQIQSEAAADYSQLLPQLQPLAEKFNQLSGSEMEKALERTLPGYRNLVNTGTANIQSYLKGEVPADVQAQLERQAAEKGVTLGTSGSQFGKYDTLRNLGLTSLSLSEKGLDAASRWIDAAAARTPTFNFGSMFINPTQRVGVREAEAQFQWQRDWLANQVKSIPSGWRAALINLSNDIEQIGRSVLSAYAGGAMGGGMGGGGGGGSTANSAAAPWSSMGSPGSSAFGFGGRGEGY